MFQLVLGIFLSVLLLVVILLLVTEVAATYPFRKHFDETILAQPTDRYPARSRGWTNLKLFFVVLGCMLGVCIALLVITGSTQPKNSPSLLRSASVTAPPAKANNKLLTDSSMSHSLTFSLQLKWEDGKMYGNNKVGLTDSLNPGFTDLRYYLLDRDGFLIKELSFIQDDFIAELGPDNRVQNLTNKFNTVINAGEFQKIEKMQAVLDKKTTAFKLP